MHRSSRPGVVQSDDDRATAIGATSAVVTDAHDLARYYPITPSVYTEQVLGVQTWRSGEPELRYVGPRPA